MMTRPAPAVCPSPNAIHFRLPLAATKVVSVSGKRADVETQHRFRIAAAGDCLRDGVERNRVGDRRWCPSSGRTGDPR